MAWPTPTSTSCRTSGSLGRGWFALPPAQLKSREIAVNIGRKSSGPAITIPAGDTEYDGHIDISTYAMGFIRCAAAITINFKGDRYLQSTREPSEYVFGLINDDTPAPLAVTTVVGEWVPLPHWLMGFAGIIKPVIPSQGGDTVLEFNFKG